MMEQASRCSHGGYNHQFVNTPMDHVICVICHLPSRDPHITGCCGYIFCKSCVENVKVTEHTSCPMCKDEQFEIFFNKQIHREVQDLRAYCTNKKKGCKWTGELRDIAFHLDNTDGCQFEEVTCPNDCKKQMKRRLLSNHIKFKCPYREVKCQYCSNNVKRLFVDSTHLEECPKLPLPCPNGCRKVKLLREDLEAHRKECPLELIQCEYHDVGCGMKTTRKRLREHDEKRTEKHLHLTTTELTSTKAELASMKSGLKSRIDNLETMLKIVTGLDCGGVYPDTSLLASQARWSMQLAATEATSLLEDQTLPAIMKFTDYYDFEVDRLYWCKDFFSHERGYKMSISLGPDSGIGDVSVFLHIRKGPHDDELTWPIAETFQVTLLNQLSNDKHVSVMVNFKDTPFDRVINDDDDGDFSMDSLIASKDLHKTTLTCAYLKNNCVILKVCKM